MNGKGLFSILLTVIVLVSTSPPVAAESEDIVIGEKITVNSRILAEDRTVYIHLPPGYAAGDETYPVLYTLDGMPYFQLATAILKYHNMFYILPEMIVVGIPSTDRVRDLTPTPSHIYNGEEAAWLDTSGGADNMLRFIEEELFPHMEAEYRTQPFRVLAGHSFGALFAIHALLSRPSMFNGYICISTSFWFDDNVLTRRAGSMPQPLRFPNRALYMSVGEGDSRNQIDSNDEFVGFLREGEPEGLRWTFEFLEGEDHGSQGPEAMISGLEFVFAEWKQPRSEYEKGLAVVLDHFRMLSNSYGYAIPVPKANLLNCGYTKLNQGEFASALEFFEYYAERFPDDPNAFDCVGETFEKMGDLGQALESYEKACRMAREKSHPFTSIFEANRARVSGKLEGEE
jgi:predicted alpha/beta superfamily hydrolase